MMCANMTMIISVSRGDSPQYRPLFRLNGSFDVRTRDACSNNVNANVMNRCLPRVENFISWILCYVLLRLSKQSTRKA